MMAINRGTPARIGHTPVRYYVAAMLLMVALPAPLPAVAQSTGLTIYNDGLVLVRRTVETRVPAGSSSQRLVLGALDPATLFSLDSTVAITSASYDGAVDENSVLRRAIGRQIVFQAGGPNDTVTAVLLGVDPERYRLPNGNVTFQRPGTPRYPADLVVVDPTVALTVRSTAAQDRLRLGYFTGGAAWQASYDVILGARSRARVTGAAVITSQALRAEDATIQLLAGAVSRASLPVEPQAREVAMKMAARAEAFSADEAASQQRVGEFHLYTLPGRTTLLPGVASSIAFFEPAEVAYERNLVVRGQIPFWGILPQQVDETTPPVEVSYTLKRPRKSVFGDCPLPGGVARIYEPDSAGRLQLVGEAATKHTPAGADLRLSAGDAFDLTAKRIQTAYTTRRDSVRAGYWRTTATAAYAVTLTNATDSAVTIDVLEERAGEWSVISSSVPAEKVSSTVTRFRVAVPSRGETVLNYRVRVVW